MNQVKSRHGIDTDCILGMPRNLRVSFLQGLADGDGHASSGGEIVSISTRNHQTFYKSLLQTLDIYSTIQKHAVDIRRKKSILRAYDIGFFRFASNRKKELENLVKMKNAPRAGKLTTNEKELITKLRKEGKSWLNIRLELWRQLGIARSPRAIKQSAETHDLI